MHIARFIFGSILDYFTKLESLREHISNRGCKALGGTVQTKRRKGLSLKDRKLSFKIDKQIMEESIEQTNGDSLKDLKLYHSNRQVNNGGNRTKVWEHIVLVLSPLNRQPVCHLDME